MNKKISINIIGKVPPPIGGVTVHTLRLYQWLKKDDTVNVVLTALNKHNYNDNAIIYTGNLLIWLVKKILFGFKEDIVHYHGANYSGLIVLYFIKLLHPSFKFVFTIHGEGYIKRLESRFLFKIIVHFILNRLDLLIVGVEHIKEQVLSVCENAKIEIIDAFLLPTEKKEYPLYIKNIFENNKYIICSNSFNIDKLTDNTDLYGLHLMAKLAQQLNKNNIDYSMIILISDINDNEYIENLFNSLKNINIVSDENLNGWQIIADSQLMIRPTSTDSNAFSIKEALLFNTSVIASDVVKRYEGTILFKYPDIDDLYLKVLECMKNINKEETFNTNIKNNIEKFSAVYKELV